MSHAAPDAVPEMLYVSESQINAIRNRPEPDWGMGRNRSGLPWYPCTPRDEEEAAAHRARWQELVKAIHAERGTDGGLETVTRPIAPAREDIAKIGRKQMVCPLCNDDRDLKLQVRCKQSGVVFTTSSKCICKRYVHFYRLWDKLGLQRYDWVNLRTLKPSKESRMDMDLQAERIKTLQENPTSNYFFAGPTAYSKTIYATALLQRGTWDFVNYWSDIRGNMASEGYSASPSRSCSTRRAMHSRRSRMTQSSRRS